jgi:hypothetical protein
VGRVPRAAGSRRADGGFGGRRALGHAASTTKRAKSSKDTKAFDIFTFVIFATFVTFVV